MGSFSIVEILAYSVTTLFIVALLVMLVGNAFSSANTLIQGSDSFEAEEKELFQNNRDRFPTMFDAAFVFLLGAFTIMSWYGSYLFTDNKLVLIVGVVLILLTMLFGAYLSNTFDSFSVGEFESFRSDFPMTNWVMNNLLLYIFVAGFGGVIAGGFGDRSV